MTKFAKRVKRYHPKGWKPRTERTTIVFTAEERELVLKHFGSMADMRDAAVEFARKGVMPDDVRSPQAT